jgi:hypothetical protein
MVIPPDTSPRRESNPLCRAPPKTAWFSSSKMPPLSRTNHKTGLFSSTFGKPFLSSSRKGGPKRLQWVMRWRVQREKKRTRPFDGVYRRHPFTYRASRFILRSVEQSSPLKLAPVHDLRLQDEFGLEVAPLEVVPRLCNFTPSSVRTPRKRCERWR